MRCCVLLCLVALAAAKPGHLPSVDVSGWDRSKFDAFVGNMPPINRGGWWIQIASKLYSPSISEGVSGGESRDLAIESYRVVVAPNGLPHSFDKNIVGFDSKHHVYIVHMDEQMYQNIPEAVSVSPLIPSTRLFVDVRSSVSGVRELDLEHDFEEEELISAVNSVTDNSYMATLNQITGEGSGSAHQRNVDTPGHTTAQHFLACSFNHNNLGVSLVPFSAAERNLLDVLACRPGSVSNKFLLVGAHYDTLPRSPNQSPGAMDNGSGVAVVLSVMQAVKNIQFKHGVCFAAFDGEELGLLGSHHIANVIADNEDLKSRFIGAVTSDMATGFVSSVATSRPAGWDTENSHFIRQKKSDPLADGIHIDGSPNSKLLIETFAEAANRIVKDENIPILESEATLWSSDHKSFIQRGLPAIDICSANHRVYKYWHNLHNTTQVLTPEIGTAISQTTIAALFKLAEYEGTLTQHELEESLNSDAIPNLGGVPMQDIFGSDFACPTSNSKIHHKHASSHKSSKHEGPSSQFHMGLLNSLEETVNNALAHTKHAKQNKQNKHNTKSHKATPHHKHI